jgi:hypothetical protein
MVCARVGQGAAASTVAIVTQRMKLFDRAMLSPRPAGHRAFLFFLVGCCGVCLSGSGTG